MIELPPPACEAGYTRDQIEAILGTAVGEFDKWHRGQTGGICEGRSWSHETRSYTDRCGGTAHGFITYESDFRTFMRIYERRIETRAGSK